MGPIIGVPGDVAEQLEQDTDLVEVIVEPDAVDELDISLGQQPSVFLLLTETPKNGFGALVDVITASSYVQSRPRPFALTVRDKDGKEHPFSGSIVDQSSIGDHLQLTYYGEPGDRRPLLRA
jgi:hypothetical protein